MTCYGVGDLIYKRATAANIRPLHFLAAQSWLFCPLTLVYAAATGSLVVTPAAVWGGLAGLLLLIGLTAFLRSLANGPISVAAPIFRLSFLITATLAIVLLDEPVTAPMVTGLVFALVSIWLLLGGSATMTLPRVFALELAVATAAFGTASFLHKIGLSRGVLPETAVAAQASVFCVLVTLIALTRDRGYRLSGATWTFALPAALAAFVAFLALLHGLAVGPASVLVPISQMGFVVTAGLGIVALGEPVTARKLAGLALALAALLALIWS
jgi:uncharacterized membrane protein